MTPSLLSIAARRKALLPVVGVALALIYYLSVIHPGHQPLPSLYPYLWPSGQDPGEIGAAILSESDPTSTSKTPVDAASPVAPIHQKPLSADTWTKFHQVSAIRHPGWAQPDSLPRSSDGALSGKGHRSSFRTNLKEDMAYFTTFPAFGLTNQFICIYTSIYMAMLSGRVPILQPFIPHYSHLQGHANFLPIGDVYDLNRLRAVLNLPIIEMWELKGSRITNTSDSEIEEESLPDELGCWSMWLTAYGGNYGISDIYNMKPHFTPIPQEAVASGALQPSLIDVVSLLHPRPPGQEFKLPAGSQQVLTRLNISQAEIVPDDHVACVDITMFMMVEPDRWDVTGEWNSGDGAWQAVGRHMRFQPHLLDLAEVYLRRTFKVAEGETIPPYIAVHIRRTDFADVWKALTPRDYAHATSVVLHNLRVYLGVPVQHILVLTDELDPEWLAQIEKFDGWTAMNHQEAKTMELHGPWYATLLDMVFMSGGIGLVGLGQSTMAVMASHRVTEWNAGVSKLVWQDYHNYVPDDWEWSLSG